MPMFQKLFLHWEENLPILTCSQETPDTMGALYEFDKFNMIWDHAMGIDNGLFGKDHGIAFIGNNGTLELDRGGWEVIEENRK